MRYFDNTRISSYRGCPRRFFFRHVLDWAPKKPSNALAFGASWHSALDTLWADAASPIPDEELWIRSCEAFQRKWVEEGMPASIPLEDLRYYEPRTPSIAFEMLRSYIILRRDFLRRIEILEIERPFAVPLLRDSIEKMYVGRLDKVYQHEGAIYVMEHKTTTLYLKPENGGPFRREFIEGFSPNSQIDGYLHAGHMLYGDKMKGVNIDAALVHKKVHDAFKIIPVQRITEQLDAWLFEALRWSDNLVKDLSGLELKESHEGWRFRDMPYLPLFPKNTDNCFSFMTRCAYADFCKMRANPLTYEEPPVGFKVEHWSPFDELELSKLGLEKDE